uniref:Zgc:113149 n=1 Tax=Gasterosteus aculeatus TaxID=69293 RepID=G3PJF9_GASAC
MTFYKLIAFRIPGRGVRGGSRLKPRFSFSEVKLLLEAVKRNRYIIQKFNQGVSAEAKKQTWSEITDQINSLGENRREVRQIMKKWADLKCDGKRRAIALRGSYGNNVRKKNLGPVERMVNKILMMSPRGGDTFHSSSDFDLADDGDGTMDLEENNDSVFSAYPSSLPPPSSTSLDPLPDNTLLRMKPVHTYSRNNSQNHAPPLPSSSDSDPASSSAALPPPHSLPSSYLTSSSLPARSSSLPGAFALHAAASSSPSASTATSISNSHEPSPSSLPPLAGRPSVSTSSPNLSDPLPAGASSRRARDHVAQMASQGLQQQRASRMLLTSVSQSLEILAQSVQLLVESQQEFVQESLLLQRETVDILRDFSNTAMTMLRDKSSSGQ